MNSILDSSFHESLRAVQDFAKSNECLSSADVRNCHRHVHFVKTALDKFLCKLQKETPVDEEGKKRCRDRIYDDRRQAEAVTEAARVKDLKICFVKEAVEAFIIEDSRLTLAFKEEGDISQLEQMMLWEKSIFFKDGEYDLINVRFQFSTIRPTMYKKRVTLKIEDFLELCLIGIRKRMELMKTKIFNG